MRFIPLILALALLAAACTASPLVEERAEIPATSATVEPAETQVAPPPVPSATVSVAPSAAEPVPRATPTAVATDEGASTERAQNDSSIQRLLDRVPYPIATGVNLVEAVDYELALRQAGYDSTQLCENGVEAYVDAAADATNSVQMPVLAFPGSPLDDAFQDMQRSFGMGPCDVHATMQLGLPTVFVYGDFDPDRAADAARADERRADLLSVEQDAESVRLSWELDLTDVRPPSPMFISGFSAHDVEITPDMVVRAPTDADDDSPRLAEVGTLAATVQVLLDEGAHFVTATDRAFVTRVEFSLEEMIDADQDGRDAFDELAQRVEAPRKGLAPWTSIGIGIGAPEGTVVATVVATALDEAGASESAARFELMVNQGLSSVYDEPWQDLISIRTLRTEGTTMIATVEAVTNERPLSSIMLGAFYRRSELFGIGETGE